MGAIFSAWLRSRAARGGPEGLEIASIGLQEAVLGVPAAAAGWPADLSLAVLSSGGGPLGRWSYLGAPASARTYLAGELDPGDPLGVLRGRLSGRGDAGVSPFDGGLLVELRYELGGLIEPRAFPVGADTPVMTVWELPAAWAHDRESGAWCRVGDDGVGLPELVAGEPVPARGSARGSVAGCGAGAGYRSSVARAIEYIRAGDVYQVNLAHELGGASDLGVRATGLGLLDASDACFGAYLERPDGSAVASASPELFLAFDARTRRLVTRPMKGTRDGAGDAEELRTAEKDRAELNMIVDLMRNDIGRVARCGSVEVELERSIETHGARDASVHQATATVSGELRGGLDVVDALTAAFPPGSVTGAPKVRAMQLIEELEGFGRGVYCGAIGYLSRCGGAAFSVAIRTADVRPAAGGGSRLRFPVGAGIVSDSRPDAEWDETLVKSASLRAALGVERVVGP